MRGPMAGRTALLAAVAAGLVAVTAGVGAALRSDVPALDEAVHRSVTRNRPGWLVDVMQAVTTLGLRTVVGIAGIAVAVAVVRRGGHRLVAAAAVLGPVGGEILNQAGKHLAGRARPPAMDALASADGYAFPSGHAVLAAAGWFTITWVWTAPHGGGSGRARRPPALASAAGLVVAAVAASRVVLGVHWLSDVIAGSGIGLAWAVALRWWAAPRERRSEQAGAPGSTTGAP